MDSINLVLLLIIGYVLYLFATQTIFKTKKLSNNKKENFSGTIKDDHQLDDLINDMKNWDDNRYQTVKKTPVKPLYHDRMFHNDYRDIYTAINNLIPGKKQLFNLSNIPVRYTTPNPNEVKGILQDIISSINRNVNQEVTDVRNPNSGWDEAVPDPQMEDGWQKFMKSLGLAPSIHSPITTKKGKLNLISIDKVQKYETEDEIRYIITFIAQKENVEDQIILKASLVQDKRMIHDEDNFFVSHNIELRTGLEGVDIVGYMSDYGMDDKKNYVMKRDKYYGVDNMEYNDITDPKYVLRELSKRHNKIQSVMIKHGECGIL